MNPRAVVTAGVVGLVVSLFALGQMVLSLGFTLNPWLAVVGAVVAVAGTVGATTSQRRGPLLLFSVAALVVCGGVAAWLIVLDHDHHYPFG